MNTSHSTFKQYVDQAQQDQLALMKIYRSEIGLINSLRKQSKILMSKLSNIEEISLSEKDNELIENTISLLSEKMHEFSHKIEQRHSGFSELMESFATAVNGAVDNFGAQKGQLTVLLKLRHELLYIVVLLDKVRSKISSLLLMNNALLAFSEEIAAEKDVYRSNLITINTSMLSAREACNAAIQRIEILQ
ncbi:MAG: hypothetical protein CMO34_01850 [Verrucomicrobia bacterium]|nr:hypothetical protein [Verrucomicrobiota bacterium]